MLNIIAAVGRGMEIGKNGGLCFKLKADLCHFKETTMGHKMLMGYNTYRSLPAKLKGREYFVASNEDKYFPEWVNRITDLEAFLKEWQDTEEEVYVIGGGSIYKQALPYAKKMTLTCVDAEDPDADTFFPAFNETEWTVQEEQLEDDNGYHCVLRRYTKNPTA